MANIKDKRVESVQHNAQSFPKAEEICKIIAACRESGVTRLTMGQLDILFGLVEAKFPQATHAGAPPTPGAEVPVETIRAKQIEQEKLSHEEQEIEAKERRIAELMLTDPLQAEEMMRDGDLEPAGDSDGLDGANDGDE
jgi:hypothetical protein